MLGYDIIGFFAFANANGRNAFLKIGRRKE